MRHVALVMLVAAVVLSAGVAPAATNYYWSNAGSAGGAYGIWDTSGAYWGLASTGPWSTAWVDASPGNIANFGGTSTTNPAVSTLTIPAGETRIVSGMNFAANGCLITGGTINLDNGGSAVTIAPAGATAAYINSVVTSSNGFTLNGGVFNSSSLRLMNSNPSLSGVVTLTKGILQIGNAGALGSSTIVYGAAGQSRIDFTSYTTNGSTMTINKDFVLSGGNINGAGQLYASYFDPTYDNKYDLAGNITCAAGATSRISGHYNTSLTVSGSITLSSTAGVNLEIGTRGFTLDAVGNLLYGAGSVTLSGNISGAGGVITENGDPQAYVGSYRGLGKYFISGNNSYTGATTIGVNSNDFATWTIKSSTALGASSTGTYVYANSALQLDGSGGALAVAEPLTVSGGGTAVITGNSTTYVYTAATTGVLRNLAGDNTLSGNITLAGNSWINSDGGSLYLSGNIGGAFGLTLGGAGAKILSGINSYTGATTVGAGTARLGGAGALPSGTAVTVGTATGTVLDLAGYSPTVASLAGGGSVSLGGGTLTVSGTASTVYAGVIGGAGALVMNASVAAGGTNTLVLSGPNTYTGPTTITYGILQFANPGAMSGLGASAANVSVAGYGATLAVNAGGPSDWTDANINSLLTGSGNTISFGANSSLGIDTTNAVGGRFLYAYAIGGGMNLTKLGGNSLVLSGANNYTGTTNVNAGALVFANAGAMPAFANTSLTVSVAAGATLGVNVGGPSDWSAGDFSTLLGLSNVTYATGSMLGIDTTNAAGPVSLTSSIAGSMGVNKLGAGTLVLGSGNAYYGPTAVTAGTLAYGSGTSLLSSSGVTVNGGALDLTGSTDTVQGLTVAGGLVTGGTIASNTNVALQSGTVSACLGGFSGAAKTTAGTVYLAAANSYAGATTVSAGTLACGINNALPAGTAVTVNGGTLDMNGYSGSVASVALTSGLIAGTGGGTLTSSAGFTTPSLATLGTITATLAGPGGLTLTATSPTAGGLYLDGYNTYSGTTTLTQGALIISNANALGSGPVVFGAAGVSRLDLRSRTSNATMVINKDFTLTGGNINGSGQLYASWATGTDNNTYQITGSITASTTTTSRISSHWTNTFILSGPITLSSYNLELSARGLLLDSSGNLAHKASTIVLGGSITGAGGLVTVNGNNQTYAGTSYYGLGNYVISGDNSYAGTSTIGYSSSSYFATWTIKSSTALGGTTTGTGMYANSALQLDGSGGALSVAEPIVINGGGTLVIGGYGGTNTDTGVGGAYTAAAGTTGALRNLAGNNTWSGQITLGSPSRINSDADTLTIAANIVGGVNLLTVGGAGNTTISGVISPLATAGTLLKDGNGTLTLTNANLYTGTTTVSAGTLQLGDGTTNGSIAGNITNNATLAFNCAAATSPTYSGLVGGTGTVAKTGAGTLTLSGPNTYSGLTTVGGGVLDLVDTSTTWTGAFAPVFAHGATIQSQTAKLLFDYAVGYDPLATITPLLNTSITASGAGVNPLIALDDGSSRITVESTLGGDADLNGTVNGADLNAVLSNYNQTGYSGVAGWKAGDFNGDGAVNGADLNTVLSNYNQSVSVGAAVPEPATLFLAAVGLLGLLADGWRRGRK
jgi:fibronectin-binding autotransporter adhesin